MKRTQNCLEVIGITSFSEVRANDAVLDQGGQPPQGVDSFDVDGAGVHFQVD